MTKLYTVTIEVSAVVVAESEESALAIAHDSAREIVGDSTLDDARVIEQVSTVKHIPSGWDAMCIPYGERGDKRIGEYLAEQHETPA